MSIIPGLPFTLVNGNVADATQVMANFNDIVNGTNSNAAHSGANSDITSLTGLTTPLTVTQGGTGSSTPGLMGVPNWAIAGGTADAITAAYSPSNTALSDGMILYFRATAANATTTPTFSPDGLSAHVITEAGGTPLSAGTIPGALAECIVRYNLANTRWEMLNPGPPAAIGGGSVSGLKVTNDAVTPNTQIDVTASNAVMITTAGVTIFASGISVTINCATNGANGLDTGALANATWYYVYLISNGTTTAGLASLSATSPTMPSGYTYKYRIGAMITDGSAHFKRTLQTGRDAQYVVVTSSNTPNLPIMASNSAGNPATPTWAAIATGAYVPTTATEIKISHFSTAGDGSQHSKVAPNNNYGAFGSTSNPPPVQYAGAGTISIPALFVLESTNIYWANNSASAGIGVLALGWTDNF